MTRLGVWIGIGLMLVGACAYALPEKQDTLALLPAFAGVIIATGSVVAIHTGRVLQKLLWVNAFASAILLVSFCIQITGDVAAARHSAIRLIADVDVLGLSFLFLYLAARRIMEKKTGNKTHPSENKQESPSVQA